MGKLATLTFSFLALLQLHNPTPVLDAHRVADSEAIVSSYITLQPFSSSVKNGFPDRSIEAEIARQVDAQKEQARLEAIRAEQAAKSVVTPQAQKPVETAQNTPTDANADKMFIYMKESGNNPLAKNSAGCLGLGQACPGSKLLAVCPTLEYACQDAFFTNYAISRYGSWEAALTFWQKNNWW